MTMLIKDFTKGFLRNARDGGWASGCEYLKAPQIAKMLPAICRTFPVQDFEIQILAGRTRLTMAFWMVASWVNSTGRHWKFVFHDDGSLTEADARRICELIPGSRVMLSATTNLEVTRALTKHPLCLQCRNQHPLGRKLIDMPLFGSQPRLLTIDTDILFYQAPERLARWIAENEPTCLFMEDVNEASLLTPRQAQEIFGLKLAEKVNTGIVAVPTAALTLDFLEDCLQRGNLLNRDRWYIEQTLYALAASATGRFELLSKEYFMPLKPPCPESAVARHYMGANRHLFYSEGLPKVRRQLRKISAGTT